MASKKQTKQSVRLERVCYTEIQPRLLGALEAAFGRLEDARDPRLAGLKPEDVAQYRIRPLADPPRAALVPNPRSRNTTLAVYATNDSHEHHKQWWVVARYFRKIPGQLPKDPEAARSALSGNERAALWAKFEDISLLEACDSFAPTDLGKAQEIEIQPVAVEAATVEHQSGSGALWVNHDGLWWSVCLIRRVALKPESYPTRASMGFNSPGIPVV